MKERVKFILEWEQRWNAQEGVVNVAELCRMFGISRQTGHVWIRRYRDAQHELTALEERSRRPHTHPHAVTDEMQDVIVWARKQRPRWGPRKLRAWLANRYPSEDFPSVSAMGAILKRRGLVTPRRRRRRTAAPVTQPFSDCDRANRVWCVDFKGWFKTRDGNKCHPLTLIDAYSRYLLRVEVVERPDGNHVSSVFDSAFREFGLPDAIRSDNGPPFASIGAGGLTSLAVWWLRLGIRLERIEPGKPQQNGRLERMHLTLKTDTPIADDLIAQQREFDVFRRIYNEERPHEALSDHVPASVYARSRRQYPRKLLRPDEMADPWCHQAKVDKQGAIRWKRRRIFISQALRHEFVALEEIDDGRWQVVFGPIPLGTLDESRLDRGLILPRRRRRRDVITKLSLEEQT